MVWFCRVGSRSLILHTMWCRHCKRFYSELTGQSLFPTQLKGWWLHNKVARSGSCLLMLLWNNFEYAETKNYTSPKKLHERLGSVFCFLFFFWFFLFPSFWIFFFFAFSDSFCEGIILLYLPCYFHKSLLLTQASQLTGKNSKKESNIEKIRWLCAILSFLVYTFCTIFIFSC